jgi:hypothetical protein
MIPLEEYKKSLGEKLLETLSEEQILKLRDQQDQMAEIFFNMWLKDKNEKLHE